MSKIWNDSEEDFLEKLEKQSDLLYKHHSKEFVYYQGLAKRFNVPILVISAINALTAIALNDFLQQRYVSIMNAVLSAGTGVLGSIQLYLKINEKMTNALRSSIVFHRLAMKISKEVTMEKDSRSADGIIFVNDCFSEFTTAIEQGNPVHRKLLNHMRLNESEDDATSKTTLSSIAEQLVRMSRRGSPNDSPPRDEESP